MLGVLPKSQGIPNKKDDLANVRSSFACYSLFSIFCFSLFLILVFFFMLFPNPAVLLAHPINQGENSLILYKFCTFAP